MGSKIIATGSYLPPKILSNDDLTQYFETSHEWIYKRTGICNRHVSDGEDTSDFGSKAALKALEKAGISAKDLGFIIVATMSPDFGSPSTACLVQDKIGASNAFAFDINAACSGFVFALTVGTQLMENTHYQYGLVIGSETMTKLLDWSDRSTAVLFGDGAGCVLLEKGETSCVKSSFLHSDGSQACSLTATALPVKNPLVSKEGLEEKSSLQMNGRDIFNFATRKVPELILQTVQEASLDLDDIDYFICHQANARMIELFAKKLKQPIEKFPMNISQVGNTSAGSIPILLDELVNQNLITLNQNQKIVLTGFGGGLTWGAQVISL